MSNNSDSSFLHSVSSPSSHSQKNQSKIQNSSQIQPRLVSPASNILLPTQLINNQSSLNEISHFELNFPGQLQSFQSNISLDNEQSSIVSIPQRPIVSSLNIGFRDIHPSELPQVQNQWTLTQRRNFDKQMLVSQKLTDLVNQITLSIIEISGKLQ